MIRVALTGGIATGKSHVTSRLRAAGIAVIDADVLSRDVVAPGTPGLAAIVDRFGAEMVRAEGLLDRARLGALVFRDDAARHDLEAIVHPAVRRGIEAFFSTLPTGTEFAVADIPLLYETRRERYFDQVIVVACAPALQADRVMARDGLSRADAERRIAAQLPIEEKVRRADFVIRTDGTFEETNAQVTQLLATLQAVVQKDERRPSD